MTTTGAPTVLAGSPVVSVYENDDNTQITSGVTLNVDEDGVVGLNQLVIVATTANGFEVGKFYDAVITTGTVGGTAVVGYVVASFTIEAAGFTPANGVVATGTAQAATGTTIQLAAAETFANDTPNGMTVMAFGSTQGYWQSRVITDYDLATDTATVDTWTVTPSGTITYVVMATPPIPSTGAASAGAATSAGLSAAQSTGLSSATAQSSAESATLSSVALRSTSVAESATLSAVALVPSLVMSVAASANGIAANVQQINDVTVIGVGTAGNKWRA